MIDVHTRKPIRICTQGAEMPFLLLPSEQVQEVENVFRSIDVEYAVDGVIFRSGNNETVKLTILDGRAAAAQESLDQAAVKVTINYANGDESSHYGPQSLVDRFDSLTGEGYGGKELIDELLTDDWGVPPARVSLEGQRADGTVFRVALAYDARRKKK